MEVNELPRPIHRECPKPRIAAVRSAPDRKIVLRNLEAVFISAVGKIALFFMSKNVPSDAKLSLPINKK